jgi:GntR family transcriptional regulator
MALNLSPGTEVSRLHRLRRADDRPMAVEMATLPRHFLDDPFAVENSLYATLAKAGFHPQRALQHIRAEVLSEDMAGRLQVPPGSAALYIERQSFLADGTPVEFTRSHYRSDCYDFVAELHIDQRITQRENAR